MPIPQILYAQAQRVNVRSAPEVGDNKVGYFSLADPLQVDADRSQVDAAGWVWRKLVASDAHWVAEANNNTGQRLLGDTAPEQDASADETETCYVDVAAVKLRSTPQITPENAVGQVMRGEAIIVQPGLRQIGPAGWVWRQLAGGASWVAEYNSRTGKRLLTAEAPVVAQDSQADTTTTTRGTGITPGVGSVPVQGRVRADGTKFILDGKPFRFMGVNLREFPFYDTDVLKWANASHQRMQLDGTREMKMRLIRMHACNKHISLDAALPLVRKALDLIDEYGMLAIVCLNDALGDSEYYVPGDEPFHQHQLGHLDKTAYFVRKGYQQNFLPYVKLMVGELADHPAIFAWELCNEPAIIPQPASVEESEAFYTFSRESSDLIRSLDANHLITTGLVNTGHIAPTGHDRGKFARRFYALPNLDFATVHFYQDSSEEQNSLPDLDAMKQLGKPLIVEEFGPTDGDKAGYTDGRVEFWLASGAAGFMQWGLSATPLDVGVGDSIRGMDPFSDRNKDHYNAMKAVYRKWGEQLGG